MKRFLPLLLLILLAANRLAAQACPQYARLMKEGDQAVGKNYRTALNKYNAARLCDPSKAAEVDSRINALFDAIAGEKLEAETQRDAAGIAQRQAIAARKQAEAATRRATEANAEARRQASEARALYWASESDKLESVQAVRLLLEAFRLAPDSPPVHERLVKRLNADVTISGNLARLRTNARQALLSSDGTRLLTATDGAGDVAQLWDTALPDPKPLATFRHGHYLAAVLFSPDDRYVLTTSLDGALLWNATDAGTPQPLARFVHSGWVRSAQFSPDGRHLLTASDDSTARLWDVSAHGAVRPLAILRHEEALTSARFSPDGHRVLTVSLNATRLWEASGQPLLRFSIRKSSVKVGSNTASFSPDGRTVLTASDDSTARLWDASGRGAAVLLTSFQHGEALTSAQFSPDGHRVLTSSDKTAKLWHPYAPAASGPLAVFTFAPGAYFRWVSFSPDAGKVLTVGNGSAKLWALGKRDSLQATLIHDLYGDGPYPINHAVFSPDGKQVLTTSSSAPVKLWDTKSSGTPPPVDTFEKSSVVHSALFSRDGSRIVIAAGGEIRLWYTPIGARKWALEPHHHLPPLSDENRLRYGVLR